MRKLTYGAAVSLDNFIARADDNIEWLMWNKEVAEIMRAYWKTIDAILMGRRTSEIAARDGFKSYPGITNYLFSRTLKRRPNPKVELIRTNAVAFVRDLKTKPGKGICLLGGGVLARSLFEADLVDEVGVSVHPILLGSGIPFVSRMSREIPLQLSESQVLGNGCVYLTYRVKHPGDDQEIGYRSPRKRRHS